MRETNNIKDVPTLGSELRVKGVHEVEKLFRQCDDCDSYETVDDLYSIDYGTSSPVVCLDCLTEHFGGE